MFRIWTLAAVRRASSDRPAILGTIKAARIARMATTTMISMKVKPRSLRIAKRQRRDAHVFIVWIVPCTSLDDLAHLENRQQDGQHNEEDHPAHQKNHDRFQEARQSGNGPINFRIIDL